MQNTIENGSSFDYNAFMKIQQKKARISALILGSSTLVALIFLVFAFIQKAEADKARAEVATLQQQMESVRKAAEEQMQQARQIHMMAQEERLRQEAIAIENAKMLEACLKKGNK